MTSDDFNMLTNGGSTPTYTKPVTDKDFNENLYSTLNPVGLRPNKPGPDAARFLIGDLFPGARQQAQFATSMEVPREENIMNLLKILSPGNRAGQVDTIRRKATGAAMGDLDRSLPMLIQSGFGPGSVAGLTQDAQMEGRKAGAAADTELNSPEAVQKYAAAMNALYQQAQQLNLIDPLMSLGEFVNSAREQSKARQAQQQAGRNPMGMITSLAGLAGGGAFDGLLGLGGAMAGGGGGSNGAANGAVSGVPTSTGFDLSSFLNMLSDPGGLNNSYGSGQGAY